MFAKGSGWSSCNSAGGRNWMVLWSRLEERRWLSNSDSISTCLRSAENVVIDWAKCLIYTKTSPLKNDDKSLLQTWLPPDFSKCFLDLAFMGRIKNFLRSVATLPIGRPHWVLLGSWKHMAKKSLWCEYSATQPCSNGKTCFLLLFFWRM